MPKCEIMEESKWKDFDINVYGSDYKVRFVEGVETEDGFAFGEHIRETNTIVIAVKDSNGNAISDYEIQVTLCHELIHAILGCMGFIKANEDEALVECLGRGILSFIKQGLYGHLQIKTSEK